MDTLNDGTPLPDEASIAGQADHRPDAIGYEAPGLPDEEAVREARTDPEEGDSSSDTRRPRSGYMRLKRRSALLAAENAELRRLAEAARAPAEPPPQEHDYAGDYFAYQNAVAAHGARQAAREEIQRHAQAGLAERQGEAMRATAEAHYDRIDEARERIADFDETLSRMRGVQVPSAVIREIMASDKSALLAYHYARNPDELAELSGMTEREIVRAVGRLEGSERLALPQPRRQTQAPAPLRQLKGGLVPRGDPDRMTMTDYRRWREAGGGR
jgi:hypothetical protein